MIGKRKPREFYFEGYEYLVKTFPIVSKLTWEEFLGALSTASYAPDEGTTAYTRFERLAKEVFSRFCKEDLIEMNGETELYLGQIG